MPYESTISQANLLEANWKKFYIQLESMSLILQSMLGVRSPLIIGSIIEPLRSGLPLHGLINPEMYRINHLPTELYFRYGFEFIVTQDSPINWDLNYDKRRIYVAVGARALTYLISSPREQIIEGEIDLSEFDGLNRVDTLEELVPHLSKLMSILERNHFVVSGPIKYAEYFQKLVLGGVLFSILFHSVISIRSNPIRGSISLCTQLFLWCCIDFELPRLWFQSILGQTSRRTLIHTRSAQLQLLLLMRVLSCEMLCAIVLFRVVQASRGRMQKALIATQLIEENPRMEIEQRTLQVIGNEGAIENQNFLELRQVSSSSYSYAFYINVGLACFGICGGVGCLLALAVLSTLPPAGLAFACVATTSGVLGCLGLFSEKYLLNTGDKAMQSDESLRRAI